MFLKESSKIKQIEKRIAQTKAKLLIEQPYFGTVAAMQKAKLNEDIQIFQSTPTHFEYNDDYLEYINDDELAFLMTNSAMHHALGYDTRKEGRLDWMWTLAQDYAINSLLVNNGLSIPSGLNYDESFDGMSAESIYNILELDAEADKHTPKETNHIRHEKMDEVDLPDENPIDAMHEQAIEKIKQQGDLPLGIELVIPKVYEGQISWRDELYTVIENSFKFDYRLSPPNKRYLADGIALPSLSGEIMRLVVCVDSSGSIDENTLSEFLGEIESIINSFENFEIDLLIADAKVQEHHVLYPGDILEYTIKGGGGTRFDTTFEYIDKNLNAPKLVLYFTDAYGTFGEYEPDYDLIWILTNDANPNIPYGRKLYLKEV